SVELSRRSLGLACGGLRFGIMLVLLAQARGSDVIRRSLLCDRRAERSVRRVGPDSQPRERTNRARAAVVIRVVTRCQPTSYVVRAPRQPVQEANTYAMPEPKKPSRERTPPAPHREPEPGAPDRTRERTRPETDRVE